MDPPSSLSAENEPSTACQSSGNEPTTSCDGNGDSTSDGGVVEPPSKKAKIEGEVNEAVGVSSSGDSSSSREQEAPTSNDSGGIDNGVNEGEHDEEEQQQQQDHSHLDSEELDFEEEEANSDDEALFQQILALARSGRIPLEYLAARGIHIELDDDEPVEYPFDEPPKSIEDVAAFIQSEKCQRIMVLAG